MSTRALLKRLLLPSGTRQRRFPFGLGAGIVMNVDFEHQTQLFLGLYEIEIAKHCRRLMRQCENAFDIGADAGYYSLVLAKQTGGAVVAVEPAAEGLKKLHANIAFNDYPITTVQAFVGAEVAEGVTTIDQMAEQYFKPDCIKMDIERGEADALRGGLHLIETHRPHMIIEVHSEDLDAECREILAPYDYAITGVTPRTWLPEQRIDDYNGWIICEGDPGRKARAH